MAATLKGELEVTVDGKERDAFRADIARIIDKYGDQPHLRKRRDAELKRAIELLVHECVTVKLV